MERFVTYEKELGSIECMSEEEYKNLKTLTD